MPHLFISYAKEDTRELALDLADALNAIAGVTAWVDRSLRAGESWELQIQHEIDRCDTMIVLYSPDINRHKEDKPESYVLTEISYAKYIAKKPIIPIMAQQTAPPISLAGAHYIDYTKKSVTFDDLIEAFCLELGIVPPQPESTPPPEPPVILQENISEPMPDAREPEIITPEIATDFDSGEPEVELNPSETTLPPEPVDEVSDSAGPGYVVPEAELSDELPVHTASISSTAKNRTPYFTVVALVLVLIAAVVYSLTQTQPPGAQEAIDSTPVPTVTANDQWTPIIHEFDGVEMVLVPPGCFMMGSDNGDNDYLPVHDVCFNAPFWIDRYEVTNGHYGSSGNWEGSDRPRDSVTWVDALAHCQGREARLPTEAEWEYAARGPDNLVYPWGNDFVADNVVYDEDEDPSTGEPEPVGGRPNGASWVGNHDMSGNVLEWVSTIYDEDRFPYPFATDDGREDLESVDVRRVLRGGSWFDPNRAVRADIRFAASTNAGGRAVGFRCARDYE